MSFRLWEVFLSRCLKSYGLSSVRLSVEDILGTEHLSTQRKEKTMKLTRKDRGQSREKKHKQKRAEKKKCLERFEPNNRQWERRWKDSCSGESFHIVYHLQQVIYHLHGLSMSRQDWKTDEVHTWICHYLTYMTTWGCKCDILEKKLICKYIVYDSGQLLTITILTLIHYITACRMYEVLSSRLTKTLQLSFRSRK